MIPVASLVPGDVTFPVQLFGEAGSSFNRVYLVSKMLVGGLVGLLASVFATWLHFKLKELNGRVFFPFQGVALAGACVAGAGIAVAFLVK